MFVSIAILSFTNIKNNIFIKNDPPYDKKGTGTPVSGIKASIPKKLTAKCNNI